MSYIITGAKKIRSWVAGQQKEKSNSASVDLIDQFNNGALAVANYAGVLKVIIDDDAAGTVYVGEAAPGSDPAAAVWRIKKLVTAGTITTTFYAIAVAAESDSSDRIAAFDHIFDNRAALTYG